MKPERREVEAKFRLRNDRDVKSAERRLFALGFVAKPQRTEMDYALDTPEWKCRLNGFILRFRWVRAENADPHILLTLKEKRQHETFQDYNETELRLGSGDVRSWNYIQAVLKRAVGLNLPDGLLNEHDFSKIIILARAAGFSKHRILLEKKRREFSHLKSRINVTIDQFPDNIGTYLEIEAHNPVTLRHWIGKLILNEFESEPLDYGEILKRHKNGQKNEVLQRTAVFDNALRELLLADFTE